MSTSGGLEIDNATFGRSNTGRKKLYEEYCAKIDNMIKVLNGDKFKAMQTEITQNWSGVDADDFMSDIKNTKAELERKLNALKTNIDAALAADTNQFKSFQEQNKK